MELKHITDDFSVSDQLTVEDVHLVAAMGFHTLICNRHDGEDTAQALFEQMVTACKLSQLTAIYMPVDQSGPTTKDIANFAKTFAAAEKPVLAYAATSDFSQRLYDAAMRQNDKA